MPKMLMQAFPIRVIGFSEKGTSQSAKILLEMSLEYNLYPPVSGPAIERMVLKMRKDDEIKALQAEKAARSASQQENNQSSDSDTIQIQSSHDQARAALSQLVTTDAGSDDNSPANSQDSGSSGPGVMIQKGSSHQSGPAYMGSLGTANNPNPGSGQFGGMGPQSGHGTFGGQGTATGQNQGSAAFGGIPSGPNFSATQTGPNNDPHSANQSGHGPGQMMNSMPGAHGQGAAGHHMQQGFGQGPGGAVGSGIGAGKDMSYVPFPEPDKGSFHDGNSNWQREQNDPQNSGQAQQQNAKGQAPQQHYARKEKLPYQFSTVEKAAKGAASVVDTGTQKVLEEVTHHGENPTANPESVIDSSNIACITIEGSKFSGYLVCALGKNKKIDKSFIDVIQKRLFAFLLKSGENLTEKDTMDLVIKQVDFTDWALEQAEFLRRSVHDGSEIAMAFFPTPPGELDIKFENSASEKMMKMDINEIQTDVPLEFDLYIFMPENNKYILYTPQGKPFPSQQKQRLGDKGITHMHLKKDSLQAVKKYKAQNYLNDRIDAYNLAKRIRSS